MEAEVQTEPRPGAHVKMLTHAVHHARMAYRVECIPPTHHLLLEEPRTEDARVVRLAKRNRQRSPEGIFLPDVRRNSADRAHFAQFTAEPVGGITIYRSEVPSDLAALRPRNGVMFETCNCLLVVAAGEDYCIAGRACLDSLVKPDGVERTHESIVQAIAHSFETKGIAPSNIMLAAFFGTQLRVSPSERERLLRLEDQVKSRIRSNKRWKSTDRIMSGECASLYHILKAQALMEGIVSITYFKPLPLHGNFAHSDHADPKMCDEFNWVFAYRET